MPQRSAYCYRAYGLVIASEVLIPELQPGDGPPDVSIELGSVPTRLSDPTRVGVAFQAGPGEYLLCLDGIGRVHVTGKNVVVDLEPGIPADRLRPLLVGPVLTAVLHQRAVVVLHASGVASAAGGVLVAGRSGAGKSTIAATLMQRGFPLLCDDLAVVDCPSGNDVRVHPGVQEVRLWQDAVDRLRGDHDPQSLERVAEKYGMRLSAADAAMPLRAIFVLQVAIGGTVSRETIAPHDRFACLRANTRNVRVLDAIGTARDYFAVACAVAKSVPIIRITRPIDGDTVDEVASLVMNALL